MATYDPVPKSVPSAQRSALITAVAAGDKIDITAVLGRPARRLQFVMTDPADIVEYRLNNLRKLRSKRHPEDALTEAERAYGSYSIPEVEVWSHGAGYPIFSSTGAATLELGEDLKVASVEITSLTLSTGTTVQIVVW